MLDPVDEEEIDVSALFSQTFVDQGRLAENVRSLLPRRSSALLDDIIALYPVERGVAEIIGYLSLTEEDLTVTLDETEETVLDYLDVEGRPRRARMPKVTVSRR
jgi:hypothetical protein